MFHHVNQALNNPLHRFYYQFKPYTPWGLRMGMRRIWARKRRENYRDVWPINKVAGAKPDAWPGWPDGKKFAVILTHDVESAEGLRKCRQLMELEKSMGFRSSFNFIPEGEYHVSPQWREELRENGFEVGVHDLRHDGKLYWTREKFSENARRINHYLKEWKACGFRSGFMFHQLDWLHELNIRYDASTFDCDPFEPQPSGRQTIFPFWVSNGKVDHGYVELPYTLPQDSTLFLLFQEKNSDIWLKKTDWIAERGGMVLVNVHPDYMQFDGEKDSARTFPVERYKDLLHHLRERYDGKFWHVTADQLAEFGTDLGRRRPMVNVHRFGGNGPSAVTAPATALKGKHAAVLLFSVYPNDARPRRETEALIRQGMEVDLICLRENENEPLTESLDGLNIRRVPFNHKRASRLRYYLEYGIFIVICGMKLAWRSLRKRYDLVHVHNMPDVLVWAALVPKLLGAKVVLDLHDPMPELYSTIYGFSPRHWFVRLLKFCERRSIAFADLVLTPNLAFWNLFTSRSACSEKIHIIMNSPERKIFTPRRCTAPAKKSGFRVMFHGTLFERHGLDTAVQAIAFAGKEIPGLQLDIYGKRTQYVERIEKLAAELGVADLVHLHGKKTHAEIAQAIYETDIGVIPNKRTAFTEINMPTRIFEYLAMNKPVIAPSTTGIRDYFNGGNLLFFEPGDALDLAEKILWAYEHPDEAREMIHRGRIVYRGHLWARERRRFVTLVSNLFKRS